MPFDRGSFAVKILKLTKDLPEDILERFNKNCAGKLDEVKDEPQIGWISGRHLLERNIDEETAILGGHIYLNLRIAQRKIPTSLLKAEMKLEELAYIKATGKADVPRKVKKDIKIAVEEKRMPQMVPTITGIPFVIDKRDNTIYLGTSSRSQADTFIAMFEKTFEYIPLEMTAEDLMLKEKINPTKYEGMFLFNKDGKDFVPGRDFLTWLWYFSEEEKGEVEVKGHGKFSVMLDGPLTFIADGDGALETAVKKGNPLKSAEAKAALKVGKKLKKAKIIMARDDETWSAGFDSDNFTFSGVTLPEGEEMEYNSRFAERVDSLQAFKGVFEELFSIFIKETISTEWAKKIEKIKTWIEKRETL